MGTETSRDVQQERKPLWAVTLDKMRAYDGGRLDDPVTLSPVEAQAFVEHYLEVARRLDGATGALGVIAMTATEALRNA